MTRAKRRAVVEAVDRIMKEHFSDLDAAIDRLLKGIAIKTGIKMSFVKRDTEKDAIKITMRTEVPYEQLSQYSEEKPRKQMGFFPLHREKNLKKAKSVSFENRTVNIILDTERLF